MKNKKRHIILAIDFDGTVVSHAYPKIGTPQPGALDVIKDCLEAGDQVIIWTCRDGRYLVEIMSYLASNGIKSTDYNGRLYFNENVKGLGFKTSNKIYADIYIDDRQFGGLPYTKMGYVDWETIGSELEDMRNKYARF